MTFGEKLYKLRKSHGLSQEALAEKLNTSRQAVSKWENNNGYPETEKIILISKLFHVKLDKLLIDDTGIDSAKKEFLQEEKSEFYVNREMANGFLLYYKKKFLLLAAACGTVLGCNAISYSSTEHQFFDLKVAPMLTTMSVFITFAIVIYIILKQNPYRVLRKKEFVFAEDVRNEIQSEFLKLKKYLISGIILGLLLFALSSSGFEVDIIETMNYRDIIFYIVFSIIITGISSFITFFCIGIYWSYSLLLQNPIRKEN